MGACAACGAANPDGNRFCGQCGAALRIRTCGGCGAPNPVAARYCARCGTALPGSEGAEEAGGERKLATVLFADVVGFTGLAARTDPEVVARLVDGAFRRMAEVVADHGGTVDKFMGDSLMAVFGVPVAHDDDAERAVAAALAMRDVGGELSFSIGVNSGEVMVTAVGREGDTTVIGDTVNVAARLEKAAGPGEVLCGGLTAELAGQRVRFAPRAPVVLPGRSEPVPVFEALGLVASAGAPAAPALPLIGRDEELAFLLRRWHRASASGRGELCLLVGEAGVGKTRLLDELAAAVAGEGGHVVRASYPGYGGLGGARLAAELIRQLGFTGDEQVDARVRSVAGELHPSLRVTDAAGLRGEQMWALRRLLRDKAAAAPLVVVLDDMHRAGPVTLELLAGLAGRVIEGRVLVVLAGRPEGEWLARLVAATTLRLDPLAEAEALSLARAVAGGGLPPGTERLVRERAGGNPLYVRELVTAAGDADAPPVPPTLRALLAARLDALGAAGKAAVQHLAVLGEPATSEQVEALGLSDAGEVLARLAADGIVRADPVGASVTVAEPLLAEVAYETLPHDRRAELHRRSASVTAGEQAAGHLARAAAYSPDDAALRAQAGASLAAVGLALADAYRPADAVRLLERAVDLGHREPAALLRLARIHADDGRLEEVDAALAALPEGLTPEEAAERDHIRASSRLFRDPATAVALLADVATRWRALGNTAKEAWAHANAGVAWFNKTRMAEAAAELEAAVALFGRVGDRAGAAAAVSFLALVRPDDERVPAWLEEAYAFGADTGDRHRQLNALVALAWNHYLRARLGGPAECDRAVAFTGKLAQLAAEVGSAELEVHGRSLAAHLARLTGRLDEAARVVAATSGVPVSAVEPGAAALAEAVAFAVACAREPRCAAPLVPSNDGPTSAAAAAIVTEALALSGRVEEAVGRSGGWADLGVVGGGLAVVPALVAVLAGGGEGALDAVDQAASVAGRVRAGPALVAARALRAELTGDLSGLPAAPPDGVAGALVLRARARHGDARAAAELAARAAALAAPGLLIGVGPD